MLPPTVPLVWRRSKRARRMTLRIDAMQGSIVLTLPDRTSRKQGLLFLQQHMNWISSSLASLPERPILANGHDIMIEGNLVPILHEPTARRGAWLDNDGLHVSGDAEHTERRVRDFLLKLAKDRLSTAVKRQSEKMQLTPSRLDLRDVRTRWGSCTRQGRIMLSWRLLMTPIEIRDYVIIHELAHLRHFDHGADFWALVDHFCSNGRSGRLAAERWLRENGTALLRAA
ncbi:metal-dependent hydrolase [Gluconobacter japonicus]|nr:metal-dependent hydrolase [Gluconobacter japonicus]